MSIVFSNVSIDRMDFVNGKHDIKFEFIDTYKDSNKLCGVIVCKSIYSFKMDTAFEDSESCFPCFICDVTAVRLEKNDIESKFNYLKYGYKYSDELAIPKSKEYHFIRMEGGEVNISIICGEIEINKV